jgi:serine/threonine protein kinase
MDLLGGSLEDQLAKCSGSLSLKTTLMVAEQTLKRIEYLHSKGYLHRDIKPENFLLSAKDDRKILIIDFGLSRKYVKDGKHMAYAEGRNLMGTVRYASLNLHYGIEPTRRDDLESWFYSLRYLRLGGLPWQNQTGPKQAKYDKILALKLQQRP